MLRRLLAEDTCHLMPCCFDALSAKLVQQEDYPLTFMSGFAASAARLGAPDLGLMSYGEVVDQVQHITSAISIPLIADGDTGYGNAMNVRRTVLGFAQAGAAAVMIEDQVAPKRCGHTPGKEVVSRDEAFDRIRAAVDARNELISAGGSEILVLARTDARHEYGLTEAIERSAHFAELGADILFVEAPQTESEMAEICQSLPGPKMANIVEGGLTPELSVDVLHGIGYSLAAYPLTLLAASMKAMTDSLRGMRERRSLHLMNFEELRERVGFNDYYEISARYSSSNRELRRED
ncbi:MAG: carboxyvinyl-carboxyphosphonate phosphorylmutase [Gammaproteobacteria bacterium]|jgi:2-methylisocitrate lyase-like PEP mutase family enzyme|nr:carboxyvinyl-carboxyphosphonate phosphorylmutase [Gammaproteobacteria bacterium]